MGKSKARPMGGKASKNDDDGITDHDRAMLDLKNSRDTLKQYQKKLTVNMERETEVARQLLKQGNKKGALYCVKKRKLQQTMYDKTFTQLENVEQLISSVETAQLNAEVFESLKQGKTALEQLNSIMSVDDVEQLLDENAEQMQLAQELDDAVQRHMGGLSAADEADIEAEYNQLLELEDLEQSPLPDAPNISHTPQEAVKEK